MTTPRRPRRVVTLIDAMALIGAAAVGLGAYQYVCRGLFPTWFFEADVRSLGGWNAWTWVAMLSRWASWLIPFAAAWTVVLPLLRARPPRPPWRRVWREPGMSACLAAVVGVVRGTAGFVAASALHHARPSPTVPPNVWWQEYVGEGIFQFVGLAVAATWTVQASSGRWRRPDDSIDRLGRLVGTAWIVIGLVWTLRHDFELL